MDMDRFKKCKYLKFVFNVFGEIVRHFATSGLYYKGFTIVNVRFSFQHTLQL
jgi:hypothetical protein